VEKELFGVDQTEKSSRLHGIGDGEGILRGSSRGGKVKRGGPGGKLLTAEKEKRGPGLSHITQREFRRALVTFESCQKEWGGSKGRTLETRRIEEVGEENSGTAKRLGKRSVPVNLIQPTLRADAKPKRHYGRVRRGRKRSALRHAKTEERERGGCPDQNFFLWRLQSRELLVSLSKGYNECSAGKE